MKKMNYLVERRILESWPPVVLSPSKVKRHGLNKKEKKSPWDS